MAVRHVIDAAVDAAIAAASGRAAAGAAGAPLTGELLKGKGRGRLCREPLPPISMKKVGRVDSDIRAETRKKKLSP